MCAMKKLTKAVCSCGGCKWLLMADRVVCCGCKRRVQVMAAGSVLQVVEAVMKIENVKA